MEEARNFNSEEYSNLEYAIRNAASNCYIKCHLKNKGGNIQSCLTECGKKEGQHQHFVRDWWYSFQERQYLN